MFFARGMVSVRCSRGGREAPGARRGRKEATGERREYMYFIPDQRMAREAQ